MANELNKALEQLRGVYIEEVALTGQRDFSTTLVDGSEISTYLTSRPPHQMIVAVRTPGQSEVVDFSYTDEASSSRVYFSMREDDESDLRHTGWVQEDGAIQYESGVSDDAESRNQIHPEALAALQTRLDQASAEVIVYTQSVMKMKADFAKALSALPETMEDIGELLAAKRNEDLDDIPVANRPMSMESHIQDRLDLLELVKKLRAELANQDQLMTQGALMIDKQPGLMDLEAADVEASAKEVPPLSEWDSMSAEEFRDYLDEAGEGHFELLVAPYDSVERFMQRIVRTDSSLQAPVVVMNPGINAPANAGSMSSFVPPNFMCVIVPYVNDIDAALLTKITNVQASFFNVYNFTGGQKGSLITEVRSDAPKLTPKEELAQSQEQSREVELKIQALAQEISTLTPGLDKDEILRRVDTVKRQQRDELGNLGL